MKETMRSEDRIRARAYELYLERGGENGNDMSDWLVAEREISATPESIPEPAEFPEHEIGLAAQFERTAAAGRK